ncbi:hypothetical protein BAE44_0007537 [Dichanthelium oligosanthes]|uniref:Uncharacterized protein n=1 Tax=Dichanthelium oligosanthes TaxID=888268 RepID=A0A1E5W237_9POAL|nr:hypothetical protein BAE44_0007537 [Dichanthelium oligosanthes]
MQIRVRSGCGESSCPEWGVVELQGVVQPQASFAGDIRGLHIGRLCSAPSPSSSKARGSLGIWFSCLFRWEVLLLHANAMVAGRVHLHRGVPRARRDEGDAQEAPAGAQEEEEEGDCWCWGSRATCRGGAGEPPTKEKKTVQPAAN